MRTVEHTACFTYGSLVGGGVSIVVIAPNLSTAIFSIAVVVDIVGAVVVVVSSLPIRSPTNSSFCSIVEILERGRPLAYTQTHKAQTHTHSSLQLKAQSVCCLCVFCVRMLF